jgi:prevent-host-death family protein
MNMKISTKMIVSNSDMIKNYKDCRNKAEELGKIFILKNNRPDAVLLSIDEYENLSTVIEYLENFEKDEVTRVIESLKQGMK